MRARWAAAQPDWERKGQRLLYAGLVGGSVCGSGCGEPARLGASAPTSFLLPALPPLWRRQGSSTVFCVYFDLSQAPAVMSGLAGIYGLERERDHSPQNSSGGVNRGAGTNGPGFSVWASGAQQGARPQGRVLELRPKGWVETGSVEVQRFRPLPGKRAQVRSLLWESKSPQALWHTARMGSAR